MTFDLSHKYCKEHNLDPLFLNLMCVRVKHLDRSKKDAGYWVGHFQISEECIKKEDEKERIEEVEENDATKKEQVFSASETVLGSSSTTKEENTQQYHNSCPTVHSVNIPDPVAELEDAKLEKTSEYKSVFARLIQSSSPVPESLIEQELCCATVELILISIPDRLVEVVYVYVNVKTRIILSSSTLEPLLMAVLWFIQAPT